MPSAGFEPAIPVIRQLQTYTLDRTDTGIGMDPHYLSQISPDIPTQWVNNNYKLSSLHIGHFSGYCHLVGYYTA
jgi:hypothetical protein